MTLHAGDGLEPQPDDLTDADIELARLYRAKALRARRRASQASPLTTLQQNHEALVRAFTMDCMALTGAQIAQLRKDLHLVSPLGLALEALDTAVARIPSTRGSMHAHCGGIWGPPPEGHDPGLMDVCTKCKEGRA